MKCSCCDSERFIAHQLVRLDVIVDGDGNYIDAVHPDAPDTDIYDSETPYGPFQCVGCGAEYDELSEGEVPFSGPVAGWTWEEPVVQAETRQGELEVVLEVEKKMKDYPEEMFYRYRVGEYKVWFTQNQLDGNIYTVGIRQDNDEPERFELYAVDRDDKFYPNRFYVRTSPGGMSTEDVREYTRALERASAVLDKIQELFENSKHYELYCAKHNKGLGDVIANAKHLSEAQNSERANMGKVSGEIEL